MASSEAPKIILLEPDHLLRKIYCCQLQISGFKIRGCTTAQLALNMLESWRATLLIMEPLLPDHNGLELLYELRTYRDWRALPVIVNTWSQTACQQLRGSVLGPLTVLYKPKARPVNLINAILKADKS